MDTLLYVVLCNAVGATILALPAAMLGCSRRWPALVHSLWLLVLLKLIAPPLFVMPLPITSDGNSLITDSDIVRNLAELPGDPTPPATELLEGDDLERDFVKMPSGNRPDLESEPATEIPPHTTYPSFSWKTTLVLIWLAGSVLWWTILVCRVRGFCRLLRDVRPAPEELQTMTGRLAQRLGLSRPPLVGLVQAPISPLVWGLSFRPRLLLPAALWEQLSEAQRETLLVHELAHLKRRDHWVRVLELAVLGLYWWHPLVWWARGRLQQAEEQCCDAWVVWALPRKAEAYATALLATVSYLSQTCSLLPVAASGIGRGRFLKRRLTMILRDNTPRELSWGGLVAVLLLAAFILPLVAVPAESTQEVANKPSAAEKAQPASEVAQPITQPVPQRVGETGTPAMVLDSGSLQIDPLTNQLGPNHPAVGAELQKLRDQIELMEAQLRVKMLQVEAARKKMEHAKKDLERVLALRDQRVISAREVESVQHRMDDLELEVKVKEAELLEPSVLLRQARRRLAALQVQPPPPRDPQSPMESSGTHLFKQREHDFGRVARGTRLTHKFVMNNSGKSTLRITSFSTTSAAVTASARDKNLGPGKTSYVLVEVDTSRFQGPKLFHVHVQFEPPPNASSPASSTLTVRADSRAKDPTESAPEMRPDNARVRDLEKKVDRLLKELDELRKELKDRPSSREQPRGGSDSGEQTALGSLPQWLAIPFQIDRSREETVARVLLYSSLDDGRTWRQVAEASPSERQFRIQATEQGTHWFAVATVAKDGSQDPADPAQFRPTLKVNVKNKKQ
jgi:beta-lactamase regulating signal transducer with metallopeptidase domain